MKELLYIIRDELGLHARPAGLLVKEAMKYNSQITIEKNGNRADAKKLFALMGLCAKKDDEITIIAEGDDEETAVVAIEVFLRQNL